jgi:hypothetical protein
MAVQMDAAAPPEEVAGLGCNRAELEAEPAVDKAAAVEAQPTAELAAVDLCAVHAAASNGKTLDAAATADAAASDNVLRNSPEGRLQHPHQELQIQQEQLAQQAQQQDCCLEEQAAAAGRCQQQQQQQQHEEEVFDCKYVVQQAAAPAALRHATSSLCRQLPPPAEVLAPPSSISNGSSSSSHPQAVFNRVTGRAGVHQPLQLDSWRDWDAMAASMDEEGGSGFGAWAAGHEA